MATIQVKLGFGRGYRLIVKHLQVFPETCSGYAETTSLPSVEAPNVDIFVKG